MQIIILHTHTQTEENVQYKIYIFVTFQFHKDKKTSDLWLSNICLMNTLKKVQIYAILSAKFQPSKTLTAIFSVI